MREPCENHARTMRGHTILNARSRKKCEISLQMRDLAKNARSRTKCEISHEMRDLASNLILRDLSFSTVLRPLRCDDMPAAHPVQGHISEKWPRSYVKRACAHFSHTRLFVCVHKLGASPSETGGALYRVPAASAGKAPLHRAREVGGGLPPATLVTRGDL